MRCFGIPKAIFPHSNKERRSGWIMPSFGSSDNRGNYLDGLGYYFAPSDYPMNPLDQFLFRSN